MKSVPITPELPGEVLWPRSPEQPWCLWVARGLPHGTATHTPTWVPMSISSSAASTSRWVFRQLGAVGLVQTCFPATKPGCGSGGRLLSLQLALRWGQFAMQIAAESRLQNAFCLQSLVLPQVNWSCSAGEDVTVPELNTVKGLYPNIGDCQKAGWVLTGGTVVQSPCWFLTLRNLPCDECSCEELYKSSQNQKL